MQILNRIVIVFMAAGTLLAQSVWEIPARHNREIQMDGHLKEWSNVPKLLINPESAGVTVNGKFKQNDVNVSLQGLWDKEFLYVAVQRQDDTCDIKDIDRRHAVWITPDHRRRDRMLFYDNLRLQIREADYDYTYWISPRCGGQGPFSWHRLLRSLMDREVPSSRPRVTMGTEGNASVLEIMFPWKELHLKGKSGEKLPLGIIVADSDSPGLPLESKLPLLKYLEWNGQIRLE